MTNKICDGCETVAHCMKNGCVPKTTKQTQVQSTEETPARSALKLALEALNSFPTKHLTPFISSARTAIREALAEPSEALASVNKVDQEESSGTERQAQPHGLEMVDDEGENRAVRMFLALYGGQCGVTTEQMCKHLKMSGFDGAWPEWANTHNGHLTKAGAQLWIRHLFALEQPAQPQQEPVAHQYRETNDDGTWSGWVGCDKPLSATDWRQVRDLYTSPPAQRKPLMDEEINAFFQGMEPNNGFWLSFARAIEAAHGIRGSNHDQ